jgi:hypothetical protein
MQHCKECSMPAELQRSSNGAHLDSLIYIHVGVIRNKPHNPIGESIRYHRMTLTKLKYPECHLIISVRLRVISK